MKKNINHCLTIGNKKYFYNLKAAQKNTTFVSCKEANIAQEFLNEDIPELLNDLPSLIIAEKEYKENQSETIRFRVSPEDKKEIEKRAIKKGYSSISGFLRDLALGNN